ncbi:MAG: hypothetical protein QOF73_5502, partial [Thermomicrobiales bacterium]|nr:hypothetical protein [Thermomicrobiales bacterium]
MQRPAVAAVVSEFSPRSHGDVIVTKLLEGYALRGVCTAPRIGVASLYLDQLPANDIGRHLAGRHRVPVFDSIGEALAVGGRGVAVDGVLLIAEFGRYPFNELGQELYPRRRFFEAALAAMVAAGRPVPVFVDKHLSWSFADARWMVAAARRLGVPLLAGSSLPLTWRVPAIAWPLGVEVSEALVIGWDGLEGYGFHALETLQCMVERRTGGECGVETVECLEGEAVWQAGAEGRWDRALLDAALAAVGLDPAIRPERDASRPAAILIRYRDGLRATVLMLDGVVSQFAFAANRAGRIEACEFHLQLDEPFGHFTFLVRQIESLVLTGQPPYPVERTLLTTGILDAAMRSRHQGHTEIETPELEISYDPPNVVQDWGVGVPLPWRTAQ